MEVAFENHRMPGPPSMLPEGYSSVEKTLDWDRYLYVESGYSTQAPSVSSYDSSSLTSSPQQPPQNPVQESAATAVVTRQFDKLGIDETCAPQTEENYEDEEEVEEEEERESNIENWMKSQDDMNKASKALPDLLKFFQDEDKLVVLEASTLLNQMSRLSIPRQVMIQLKHLVVPSVVNCLCVTKDIKTAYNLVGALYGISQQVPEGVQAIADSESALSVLIKMLESGLDSIISFAITILHSVLTRSCTTEIKTMMRERNIVSILIMLLGRNQRDAKFLAIVVDSLYWLTHGNRDAKMLMLNMGGTQQLISLLYNHSMQYPKLILNTIRVLKLLSLCNENKNTMIEMRVIQLLANQLRQQPEPNSSSSFWREITENCLQIMRNLSSVAAQLQLAELGQWNSQLLAFISSSQEPTHIEIAAGILANFTTREPEKIAAIEANAIPIMLNLISYFSQGPQASAKIVAPSMCVLHHLTIRHSMAMFAQEQVIAYRGLPILVDAMMSHVKRNKAVLKETIDVIYNFACNQLNFEHLRQCEVMLKLMQVLFEAVRAIEIKAATSNGQTTDIKEDGVSLTEIVKKVCETLKLLVKDNSHKKMMLDWECISFLVKTHESGLTSLRNCVKPVLEELATSPDCLQVIEAHIAALRAARPQ